MRFLEKISQKYYSKLSDLQDINDIRLLFKISVTAWLTLVIYVVFGFLSLFNHNLLYTLTLVFGIALNIFFLIILKKITRRWIVALSLMFISCVIITFLLITKRIGYTGLFWFFAFPVLFFSFFGHRKGALLSLLVLFLSLSFFISEEYIGISFETNQSLILRYIAVYVIILVVSYFIEKEKEIFEKFQNKSIIQTKKENKRKDDFLSLLSHQIRTPLNNLTMVSNLLDREKLDAEQQDLFDTIIASTNNLINVVNNIVKESKVDIYKDLESKVSFDLYSTIENTLKLFRSQYKENVDIDFLVSDQIQYNVIGDPIRLKQVFLNLLGNILKVSEFPLAIGIDVSEAKKYDNNVDLFFSIKCPVIKVDNSSKRSRSLADYDSLETEKEESYFDIGIVERIVNYSNNKLEFKNNESYSVFNFTLPFIIDVKKVEIAKAEAKIETPVLFNVGKKINLADANILLVEDNAINQKIVILSLKNYVKNIDIAFNGKEALDKFGKSKYDLILMDIQMPVMNGIVATKKIRELEAATSTHVPIIAITANALSGDKETCLAAGMNDYISKPFQIDSLVNKMKKLVE